MIDDPPRDAAREAIEPAAPQTLAPPTDPQAKRLLDLTGFAAEIALWHAFGKHLLLILAGDGTKPGLLDPDLRRRLRGIGGKVTVKQTFIPDPPPWPASWPDPATQDEAVQLKALKLHMERLRAVHADLKLEPAKAVKFGDRVADLPGFLIPSDYETKIEAAAARLGVLDAQIARAAAFLPALPESARAALPELAWPEAPQDLKLIAGPELAAKPN